MDKPVTYEMAKALRDQRPLALLAEFDFPDQILRYWTGVGTLQYNGPGRGLTAKYYNSLDLTGDVVYTSIENPQFHFPSNGSPRIGVNATNYSARWTGTVISPITGTLTLGIGVDDGGRLYVNDVLVIDAWIDQALTYYTYDVTGCVQGVPIKIQFDYYEKQGGADARLLWAYSGSPLKYIPDSSLFASEITLEWMGVGLLGNITPVQAVNDISIQEVNFTLRGVTPSDLALLAKPVRNRQARTWLAALNLDGTVVRDPFQILACEMDTIDWKVDAQGLATVTVIARSGFYSLDRATNDAWSDEDQQRRFPGDTGMKYLAVLQNQDVTWSAE